MMPVSLKAQGLLLVNKPSGPTTYDLIRWIKRKIKNTKIGHCGTLDPLAAGLVIILLGRATKKQSIYMGQDKDYEGTIRLGVKTDTGDLEGRVIEEKPVPSLRPAHINDVFQRFVGPLNQMPPMYSALKMKGKPLYQYARKGVEVTRQPRQIHIHSLSFVSHQGNNELLFKSRVSSGTYVRVLAEDIGEKLGTCATLASLTRSSIGEMNTSQAVDGDALKDMSAEEIWERVIEGKSDA